jgi:homoserine dehydrogenase
MKQVTIGMIGLGTVGTGVARLLTDHADRIARRAGRRIRWAWAAVRDLEKPRDCRLDGVWLTTDVTQVINDPDVDIIIETMGGTEPALEYVLAALAAGKHVVTANKALLAKHGAKVFAQARSAGRAVAFEGCVGGGIPIIQALGFALAANQVQSIAAIVNGTCNFILTQMTRAGLKYADALRQAQALGYAEADPGLDVDGTDTAHKLAILAQLAFETSVVVDRIPCQGIDLLQLADLKYAGELGYTIKLLALAKLSPAGLELRVAPTLVKQGTPLA